MGIDRILVSLDRSEGATVVLEKALTMANASNAVLEVVHVIYEGIVDLPVKEVEENQELKTFIMETAESWLEDQPDSIRCKVRNIEAVTIWNKHKWHGIINAAAVSNADLIIKAVDSDEIDSFVRTPQDINLIRHSEIPVMLVKDDAWVQNPVILVAVDALNDDQAELSKRILSEADHLRSILDGDLVIAVTYPMVETWVKPSAMQQNLERSRGEIERAIKSKVCKYLFVEEGRPAMRIKSLIEETKAEILVIGTVARTGVKNLVIGNTSEAILHYTHCDVVVLR